MKRRRRERVGTSGVGGGRGASNEKEEQCKGK